MPDILLQPEDHEYQWFYRFSLWWVNHREQLKKIGIGMLLAFDIALGGFVLWTFVDSFLVSYGAEQRAVAGMAAFGQGDMRAYSLARAALPFEIGDEEVLSTGNGRHDIFAFARNSNADWYAQFTYRFRYGESATPPLPGFLLPGEEKPLAVLGVASETLPGSDVVIQIENLVWRRVNRHTTGDYANWIANRFDFEIKDIRFSTDVSINKQTIGRTSFTVTNRSAFSYYDPEFLVMLRRGSSVVGMNRILLPSLDAGESRAVEVNWFGALPAVGETQIIPSLNVFDLAAYKPLQGESSLDTRNRVFGR